MDSMNNANRIRLGSPLLSGLVYAFIMMGIATVLVSLLLMVTDKGEGSLGALAYGIHGVSVLTGSFVSGRKAGRKGWYYGGLLGVLFGLIVLAVGFLSFDRGLDWNTLSFLAGAFLAGAFGGILGVNAKR